MFSWLYILPKILVGTMIKIKNSRLTNQAASIFCIVAIILTIDGKMCEGYRNVNMSADYDYGETIPRGNIYLDYYQFDPMNQSALQIDCFINIEKAKVANFSVEDLVFKKEDQNVDPSYVSRINDTGIRLYIDWPAELSENMYFCYLQKNISIESTDTSRKIISKLVGMNWVVVGAEPRQLSDFSCVFLNWQKVYCSWKRPENYLHTNYLLESTIYSSDFYNVDTTNTFNLRCEIDGDTTKNFCLWPIPDFGSNLKYLEINIEGHNSFRSISSFSQYYGTNYIYKADKNVLLERPKDVHLQTKNSTSMTLQWNIAENLNNPPWPIVYKIQYKPWNTTDWHVLTCKDVIKDDFGISCTISGLTPKTDYYVSVYVKTSAADDEYWSKDYGAQIFSTD